VAFIKESWYAALWVADLGTAPIRRTYLGTPVVLYRGAAGQPIALADSCPHRFAPLSRGKLHGDAIQCLYHGLRFGPDGRCVHNPHGPIPSVARVRTYPLREHGGLLWIWMGAAPPDESSMPDVELLTDASWAWVHGSLHVNGNYQLVIDNLLDLTHVDFMHPFLAQDCPEPLHYQAKQEGERVFAIYGRAEARAGVFVHSVWPEAPPNVRMWANMRWDAPANLFLDIGFARMGGTNDDALKNPAYHLLTPETETTTHYFWAVGRNMRQDDPVLSENLLNGVQTTFINEDEPMIAAIQAAMGSHSLDEMRPLLLNIDNAAVRARRVVARRLESEAARERSAGPGSVASTAAE
jgi:phenylpropionate dioxygenase-like ring-hydroxylating dioxygenase large terminal subunit